MKALLTATILIATTLAAGAAAAQTDDSPRTEDIEVAPKSPRVHLAAGIGLPEWIHAEVSFYPLDSLSIDFSSGIVIFNVLAGVGATYLLEFTEAPLRQAITFSGRARLNVIDSPLELRSGGERLGGTVDLLVGYMVVDVSGLFGRVRAGAIFYEDSGIAAAPILGSSVGWRF